tara:strand:+ start:787 stop:2406 length:1620 start_codon:yes stop_codon:yes gene_type:complete
MSELGYSPKDLTFDSNARKRLQSGIEKISKAVKSTLGPRGKTVLIESQNHTRGITVTKDGVTVAKSIDLLDPVENLAIRMVKEAADNTATSAGDGTTTAIVLTEAIASLGMDAIDDSVSSTEVIREIGRLTDDVVKRLKKMSRKLGKRGLLDVATISSNNDKEIGRVIADVYGSIGDNGLVTVEKSMTEKTYHEVTDGIKIEKGYTNKMFVNNQKKDECILEDAHILMTDHEITNVLAIESILKPVIQSGQPLLIIGSCSNQVVNTLAANVVKSGLKICNIMPPQFGYKQHELMGDIAVSVGGKFMSESLGDDLSTITMADLGKAEKVIVGKENTIILRNETNPESIKSRVEELWVAHDHAKIKHERDFVKERIASLTGGIGVIYVGANSDIEQKEKYDRVDDAVCAVRSALEEGVLPGGGLALYNLSHKYMLNDKMWDATQSSKESRIANRIMSDALVSPMRQIMINAGLDLDTVMDSIQGENVGYDVKNDCYGDMFKMGVVDPLKVTKNALKNASSVATTILSTNAIVTLARTYTAE